jgi:Cu-Zn family superoxide dismutase
MKNVLIPSVAAGALSAVLLVTATSAQSATLAQSRLDDAEGTPVGMAYLRDTPAGVLLHVKFDGLPPGTHAFHIHKTGKCEAPSFKSAGGHYAPQGHNHGFLDPNGPHAGDMPNIHVPESGKLEIEVLTGATSVQDGLLAGDGTALVVHAGADDYHTDPAGDAGKRIACGVIEAADQSGK